MGELTDKDSDAALHLGHAQQVILQLEKTDAPFLKNNHAIDEAYFDLRKIPAQSTSKKQTKKSEKKAAT